MIDPTPSTHPDQPHCDDPEVEFHSAAISEPPPRERLWSPLTGERLTERQVLALAFSREAIQRQRPLLEKVGREVLLPTPGGKAWALLPTPQGAQWFPVERLEP